MERITITKLDPQFKYEIAQKPGAENIKKCYACGTCTAGCPVFHVEHAYNPRKIIRMILLGMREQVLSSKVIWLCLRCYTCTANCPHDVDFSNIMMTLREMAIEAGHAPPDILEKIDAITMAANDLRKDCINLILKEGEVSKDLIRERFEETLENIG
jgi:heterodisulfide reductase subunit C